MASRMPMSIAMDEALAGTRSKKSVAWESGVHLWWDLCTNDASDTPVAAAEELEAMIAVAVELVGGAREAIAFARKRHAMWKVQLHPGTSHPAVTHVAVSCVERIQAGLPLPDV